VTDWTSLNYVVVDVEGNGQQPPELVELAVVPIVGSVVGNRQAGWCARRIPLSTSRPGSTA
jgi:hypothetical protein